MNYLLVVAHPDDEILGAGGAINTLIKANHNIAICTLAATANSRKDRSATLQMDQLDAYNILGIKTYYNGDFPDGALNTVDRIKLVQFIENTMQDFKPDVIITHHPTDLHPDHQETSKATQEAMRLFQRQPELGTIKQFLFMEVPSSTDWALNTSLNQFKPNYFVEIFKEGLDTKLKALKAYKNILHNYPHPRSEETLTGLALYRGSQAKCTYAEAFELVFEIY